MFVFYDTETTGIDKDFTQILQIGLLFTDDDLNILSSKKADCRNTPWALPSPGALLTTGFTPDSLKSNKNTNYDMMQDVNSWIRSQHWPITFVGYNSIDYDEPILAQNLYQNLLPSGLTTSKNDANGQSNGRADVMYLVEATALYMPGALKLDALNYYGSPSLTLKNVAKQNGVCLSDEDAHDALNDIKATVGVAKVIKKAAPQIFDQMMKLSTVEGVNTFLGSHEIFTSARFMHGKTIKSSVMTSLAEVKGSTTQALFDLRTDPTPYLSMTVDQLKDVFLSKSGNPFVMVQKQNQPVLMPMDLSDRVLTKEDNITLYKSRAKAIKAHKGFLENVAKAAVLAKQVKQVAGPTAPDVPELMVDKHVPAHVQAKLDVWVKEFHTADDWKERTALVEGFRTRFKEELAADPSLGRFPKLAGRIVFEHAPQELSAEKQVAMKKFIASRLLNPDLTVSYMTIAKARKELSNIEWQRSRPDNAKWQEVTDTDIRRLKLFYTAVEKEFAPYAPQAPAANNNTPEAPVVKKPSTGFNGRAPKV